MIHGPSNVKFKFSSCLILNCGIMAVCLHCCLHAKCHVNSSSYIKMPAVNCESKSCSCYYGSITVVTIQDASSDSVLVTQRVPANRYNLMWRYVYTDFHILHFTLCHIRSYNSRHDATKLSECVSLFTVVSVSVCVVSVYLRREKLTVRLSVTTVFFQRYFVQTMLHVSALS